LTGGFFWGQKNAVASFTSRIEKESFGDQIYSSLCSLCDTHGDTTEEVDENSAEPATDETEAALEPSDAIHPSTPLANDTINTSVDAPDVSVQSSVSPETVTPEVVEESVPVTEYYAQLAGFGTIRAAQHFANHLQKKEISVIVKKRQSRSSRGKFVSWYQVVTEKFNDKGDLEALVKRLEYEEKLNDVRIVAC
jgi:hypothetical protein